MELLFWSSIALAAYVYAGYPALLRVWASIRPRRLKVAAPAFAPGVSVVIAARNEASRLGARIDNLLSLDYPPERLQIIVVSDGSTDGTFDVLSRYRDVVDLVALPPSGKATALNAGVERAQFGIVVFADARQLFATDALRQLVAPLADPSVGAVTGELLLDCESALFSERRGGADRRRGSRNQLHAQESFATNASTGARQSGVRAERAASIERRLQCDRRLSVVSTIADGVGMYWRYEKELRRLESTIGSTLGVTGAIYAMRRRLWSPLPAETVLDDVLAPMRVVMAGHRVVLNERAQAFDRAARDADAESRRKIRTLAGNYQILWLEPALLLPWRNPVWLQYASHKLGRLAVPYAMLVAFWSNVPLASGSIFYQATLALQVGFLVLAGYGALLELTGRAAAAVPSAAIAPVDRSRDAREIA